MPRVLTALQPTGILHIGNYFGAIEPMIRLQEEGNENLLFVVDYHAITVPQDPAELRHTILFATATYLAAGIDPTRTLLFQQSQVPQHTELAWILSCIARMGEMERMTQYKDKALGKGEQVSVGLFAYPLLMAADILLYDTEVVPVGADQKQHVELARDLAQRFNRDFGETFVVPEPQIRERGARIMGLDDPTKKMSKSATSAKNFIALTDDADTIRKKISSAVTDTESSFAFDPEHRPGLANLLTIFSLVSSRSIEELSTSYNGRGYGLFKTDLAEALISFLAPIQSNLAALLKDTAHLQRILDEGSTRAREQAEAKMKVVRARVGVR